MLQKRQSINDLIIRMKEDLCYLKGTKDFFMNLPPMKSLTISPDYSCRGREVCFSILMKQANHESRRILIDQYTMMMFYCILSEVAQIIST